MTIRDEQCGTKRRFTSLNNARKSLKSMRRSDGLIPYYCPHCRGFHIGNGVRAVAVTHQCKERWRFNPNEDYDQ